MSTKLANPPLAYALAQIIFSPIMAVKEYVPNFQESVRGKFPRYQEEQIVFVKLPDQAGLGQNSSQMQPPPLMPSTRWHFLEGEEKRGLLLTNNALSFHAVQYTSFEDHLKSLMDGADALHRVAQIGIVERIGLRYVNCFSLSEKDAETYLYSGLKGFMMPDYPNYNTLATQSVIHESPNTTLRVCSIRGHGNSLFPQELLPIPFTLPNLKEENIATLDFDCFVLYKNQVFDADFFRNEFERIHKVITNSFHYAIKPDYFV